MEDWTPRRSRHRTWPWPLAKSQPTRSRSVAKKKDRDPPTSRRIQPIRSLKDDRAATYNHYNCGTCDRDNSCCRCPDPRPQVQVPEMYVIDMQDHTVRRLTHTESIGILYQRNHDMNMETFIGRSYWRGLYEDPNAWHSGPPDPFFINYANPKFIFNDDDHYH
jgi:hypothetical protein